MTDDQKPSNYETTVRFWARDEAEKLMSTHRSLCPFTQAGVETRLRGVETRFATLVGFMVGSGVLGGATGALLGKLLQ